MRKIEVGGSSRKLVDLRKWENGQTTYTTLNLTQIPQRIRTMARLRKRTMVEQV
jgi:hypothetical protein